MKILLSLFVVTLLSICATNQTANKFEGTYNGLTENMEFKFTSKDGKVHLFQEYDEEITYDLYEDEFVGKKFKVTWEEKETEVIDEENEEVSVQKVKVITYLDKL